MRKIQVLLVAIMMIILVVLLEYNLQVKHKEDQQQIMVLEEKSATFVEEKGVNLLQEKLMGSQAIQSEPMANEEAIEPPEGTMKEETVRVSSKKEVGKKIGEIHIPKIKVKENIIRGIGVKELKKGVGHYPNSAMPGEIGNMGIAGHRSYTFGEDFNRLNELEKGDTILVKSGKNQYQYKVYEKIIVEPNNMSVLYRNDSDRILTLVTCHPIQTATHRLVIHAIME